MRSLRDRLRTTAPTTDASVIAKDAVTAWNSLYTLGVGVVGAVDGRGIVYPDRRELLVEVWFGVGERWLRGGSADGVRQRRVDGLPIIETRQRAGEKDLVQTAWADESGNGTGRINLALVNETDDAVIAAIVVRPFATLTDGSIGKIRCVDSVIVADRRPVVDIGRTPGDCATAEDSHRASPAVLDALSLATGQRAQSWEMVDPHGRASLAAMIPLTPGIDRVVQIVDGREQASVAPAPLDAVQRGWSQHLREAAEIDLPTWPAHIFPSLTSSLLGAVEQQHRPLGDRSWSPADDALLVCALGAIGLGDSGLSTTADLLAGVTTGAIERDRWADVAGAIAAMVGTGEAERVFARESDALIAVVGHVLSRLSAHSVATPLIEAVAMSNGPGPAQDASQIVAKSVDPAIEHTLLRHGWLGPNEAPALTDRPTSAEQVAIEMIASVQRFKPSEPLMDLRAKAGSSWRWSRGANGDSPHVRAQLAIALATWCRRIGSADATPTIDLIPGMRASWYGQSLGFNRLPTAGSRLSVALRWHGARPALLWEFDGAIPDGYRITCASLDRTFSSVESSGEHLLEAPLEVQR